MCEAHMFETKLKTLYNSDSLESNRYKSFFILSKYIKALDYADKTLIVLPGTSSGVSLCSFTSATSTPVRITSANISLVFLISNGIVKIFLKTMGRKRINLERLL